MSIENEEEESNGLYYPLFDPINRCFPDAGVLFYKGDNDDYYFKYRNGKRKLKNIGGETVCLIPENAFIPGDLEMYNKLLEA